MNMNNGFGGGFMGDLNGFKKIISEAVGDALDQRDMGITEQELDELHTYIIELEESVDEKQNEIDEYLHKIAGLEGLIESREGTTEKLFDAIKKLRDENSELENRLSEALEENDSLKTELEIAQDTVEYEDEEWSHQVSIVVNPDIEEVGIPLASAEEIEALKKLIEKLG